MRERLRVFARDGFTLVFGMWRLAGEPERKLPRGSGCPRPGGA